MFVLFIHVIISLKIETVLTGSLFMFHNRAGEHKQFFFRLYSIQQTAVTDTDKIWMWTADITANQ